MTFKEQPQVKAPAFMQGPRWEDHSWRNDAAAAAWYMLGDSSDEHPNVIVVWVAEEDPKDREIVDSKRFGLQLMLDIYDAYSNEMWIVSTDSEEVVKSVLSYADMVYQTFGRDKLRDSLLKLAKAQDEVHV